MSRPRLTLLSASPRRLDLLAQIGVVPDHVASADIDETPKPAERPRDLALRLAREKAAAFTLSDDTDLVLTADTVVAVGRRILPKAETDDQVRDCLRLISGRNHIIWTGVCVTAADGRQSVRAVDTRVKFKRLSAPEVSQYIQSSQGIGKAGGYGIQGLAGAYVHKLIGSYTGVVGLPVYETAQLLAGYGYPVGSQSA